MKFLTNPICDFKIISNVDLLRKPINCISSVFFKRDQYYKNFGTYVKGLKKLLNFIGEKYDANNPNSFIVILFIDNNILEDEHIMKIINNSKITVPVLFGCPNY